MESDVFVAGAVQASPVFLDRDATVEKGVRLIEEAAGNGAKLVAFPETSIPACPGWIYGAAGWDDPRSKRTFARLQRNAVEVPSAATDALCDAARAAGAHVVVGIHERDTEFSTGTIYNSLLFISGEGEILGIHRKLVPTHAERIVWGRGGGFDAPRLRHHTRASRRIDLLGALDAAHSLRHARQGSAGPRCGLARCARESPPRQSALRLRRALLRPVRGLVHDHGRPSRRLRARRGDGNGGRGRRRGGRASHRRLGIMGRTGRGSWSPWRAGRRSSGEIDLAGIAEEQQALDAAGHYGQLPDVFSLTVDERPRRQVELDTDDGHAPLEAPVARERAETL